MTDPYEHIGSEPLEKLPLDQYHGDYEPDTILAALNAAIDRINDLTIACEIHLGRINDQDKALDFLDTQNLLLAGRVKALEDARQRELEDLEGAA